MKGTARPFALVLSLLQSSLLLHVLLPMHVLHHWLGLLSRMSLLIPQCICCCVLSLWLLHVLLHSNLSVQLLCVLCYSHQPAEDTDVSIGMVAPMRLTVLLLNVLMLRLALMLHVLVLVVQQCMS